MTFDVSKCLAAAKLVSLNAHSPYGADSAIGVALETDKGIQVGCTLDNCAFPNSICGVKAAFCIALSERVTKVKGVAIVGTKSTNPYICGQCREIMAECGDIPVAIASSDTSNHVLTSVGALLPGKTFKSEFISGRSTGVTEAQTSGYSPAAADTQAEFKALYDKAILACSSAYIPASNFPVGAAVVTDKGLFMGSNVEFGVIGIGLCAERVSLCKAAAAGAKEIKAIAVVCYKMEAFGSPCGGCRQNLVEFEDFPVHLLKMNHKEKSYTVNVTSTFKILPDAFTPAALK